MEYGDLLILELARIERRAYARVAERMAREQLGEVWQKELDTDEPRKVP